MHLLGIDYGRVHLGLALAKENLPQALKVIKSKSDDHKLNEIVKICQQEKIDRIVIGKGSGELENHIRGFINKLQKRVNCQIVVVDEELTSSQAVNQMIKEGIPQKKRRKLEHAFAAVLLLRIYIQENYK